MNEFKLENGTVVRYSRADGFYSIRLKLDDHKRKTTTLQTAKHSGHLYAIEIPSTKYTFDLFKTEYGEWLRNWVEGHPPHLEEIKAKILEGEPKV